MMARIRILSAAVAGSVGVGMFHFLSGLDHHTRLLTLRVFEIAYRLYSLPV